MKVPDVELRKLLAELNPQLHAGVYVFCVVQDPSSLAALPDVARMSEPEGTTLVLREEDAIAADLEIQYRAAWITLRVHSELKTVGLTAAFSSALASRGIGCNVIAGVFHDHLFVPAGTGMKAVAVLQSLPYQYFQIQRMPPLWLW
ncbi:MAG: ACT domain-containing protein [Pseudomonadota bacterium]